MVGSYLDFPPEGVGLDEQDRLLRWFEKFRDPVLWHQLACELYLETPGRFDYLLWIVRQTDCDRATAAAVFVVSGAHLCLHGGEGEYDERSMPIAAAICSAAANGSYHRSEFPDPSPMLPASLAAVRESIDAAQVSLDARKDKLRFEVPSALLNDSYPKAAFTPRYLIEQDSIVRIDRIDDRSRRILEDPFGDH